MHRFFRFVFLLLLILFSAAGAVSAQCNLGSVTNIQFSAVTTSSATVSWSPVSGASDYKVRAWPTGSPGTILHYSTGASTSRTMTGLPTGTNITVEISPGCGNGEYSAASVASFMTLDIITDEIAYLLPTLPNPTTPLSAYTDRYICVHKDPRSGGDGMILRIKKGQNYVWVRLRVEGYGDYILEVGYHTTGSFYGSASPWCSIDYDPIADAVIFTDESIVPFLTLHSAMTDYAASTGTIQLEMTASTAIYYGFNGTGEVQTTPCIVASGGSGGGGGTTENRSNLLVTNTAASSLLAYPMPFTDQLQLRVPLTAEGPVTVALFNALGQRVAFQQTERMMPDGNGQLALSLETAHLQPGAYILRVETAEGSYSQTVIRQE